MNRREVIAGSAGLSASMTLELARADGRAARATAHGYKRFRIDCDLCAVTISDAAVHLGPAFVFELRVDHTAMIWARGLCRRMGADVQENPLAPYINIVVVDSYREGEWSLHANGNGMGSPGF